MANCITKKISPPGSPSFWLSIHYSPMPAMLANYSVTTAALSLQALFCRETMHVVTVPLFELEQAGRC